MPPTGFAKTIDVGAISANENRQYAETTDPLSTIRNLYGYVNYITVTNMSTNINLMILLDGDSSRQIFVPGGAIVTWDNQSFRYFNLVNLTANTSAGGEVYILVGFEPGATVTGLK